MTSSSSFLPTYTPNLPTDLTPETISFLTLLPLLTHTLRTLLTSTTTPRRLRLTPLPRLLLTWSTLFALIVRDTTTQPPPLSTTTTSAWYSSTTPRTPVPASTALLVAAVVPTFLILLDEAIALSGRRQRRCVAVRHPLARWGEGVVMVAVGFDVLFVVWAVVVGVWFGPAAAGGGQGQQWQQQQQQQQQAMVGYYDYDYERRNYAWSDDEYRLRLALRQGDWRRAADCVLVAVMLIPGWYLAYKIHGVEPDARDFPLLGRRWEYAARRRGEEVDDMPWDEWVRIGVAQFALDFCFLMWSVLVWVE